LITGTNVEKLSAARNLHPNIDVLENNAAEPTAATALAAEAERLYGRIDGAFFNAGVGGAGPLRSITPDVYRKLMDLNVGGPLFGSQALVPLIREGGSILITSSAVKDRGVAGAAVYSATKGAVRSLARSLARELLPRLIRVNIVSPGPIETPFFERMDLPADQVRSALEKHIELMNPMGRMGTAEEAAAVAVFLLSSEASFVTGADYSVDGGEAQL
jgi:NAD(P)-dependent dehydrogenase (short-subunit alcohol dehydrogenase family)